jgi:voltage-gated sodium channel
MPKEEGIEFIDVDGGATKPADAKALKDMEDSRPVRMLSMFELMYADTQDDIDRREGHYTCSILWNVGVAVIILANAIIIGFEVDSVHGDAFQDRIAFMILDVLFCVFFLTEFACCQSRYVRDQEASKSAVYAFGWDYFADPWNAFDFLLVVASFGALITYFRGQSSVGIKLVAAVRIIRLLRIVRNIKGQRAFRELWFIVQGMLDSLTTLLWVALLLGIIVYCVAVVLTSSVGHDGYAEEQWEYAQQYVGTVPKAMWTVVQVITFDAWATDVVRPMNLASPGSLWLLLATIIVCSFGVLNVIVAVMVQHTRKLADENLGHVDSVLEEKDKQLLHSMAEEFHSSDEDGNAELSFDEFKELLKSKTFSFKLRLLGIHSDEAESLFGLLDADRSGTVSHNEFVMGLQKIKGVAKGQDLVQLISFANRQCLRATKFVERVQKLNEKADIIQERLNHMGRGMTAELLDRKQASDRNDEVWRKAAQRQQVISKLDEDRRVTFPQLSV